ncbi:stAR-related lipid transfer protein 7, mitochondrial-like [Teleopsis dalmanni]|uniref:stAR-related lipid transfer protein 7, mitochondrial-like n=1 Tax=Teleopsis dalmanni TaxID=139649 RepID=UPI0018CE64AB|nr:stAR-related lipid transfer protein 7, mitochondrial-like [Teleopsis dalmanni]XP_037948965.1 stAR-related lipid transfer protein 7, mitochondrial-like [Teleopsis dalmanni]XP_037948966.1 stAR-related lipid transfer protein 7, mitochondrial-like [Teleopsis dalmanni]
MVFYTRFALHLKRNSQAALLAWKYQCNSIIAQRSRRVQQIITFYHRVYGSQALKLIIESYQKRLKSHLERKFLVCAIGLSAAVSGRNGDWRCDRISIRNFDNCSRDIEFIQKLQHNKLCAKCRERQMKYCYCHINNKECNETTNTKLTISNWRSLNNNKWGMEDGLVMIEEANQNPWEPYLSKNEFSIWRREESSLRYAYKVYASFDDITAIDLLHVQTDVNYRKEWDETAVRLEIIEEDPEPCTNSHLIYWEMQWPRFFANRDYVYSRRYIIDDEHKLIMICSRGITHPNFPVSDEKVRVDNYWSYMVISPFGKFNEPGVHFVLTYYDDPGVALPEKIKSWVTQQQMPDFLRRMYEATKNYSEKRTLKMNRLRNRGELSLTAVPYSANVVNSNFLWRIGNEKSNEK